MKDTFYILWSPQGTTPPRVKFTYRRQAEKVAAQMLRQHPNNDFHVMKCKSTHRPFSMTEKIKKALIGMKNVAIQEAAERLADAATRYVTTVDYFGKWRPGRPGAGRA